MNSNSKYSVLTLFVIIQFLVLISNSMYCQLTQFESSFLLNDVYPNDDDPFWMPNNSEVQGIGNDGNNWFITITGHTDFGGTDHWARLWKIPLSVDIGSSNGLQNGVLSISMTDIPQLNIAGNPNWHWGDPDYYRHEGVDYILVPSYPVNGNGVIIFFRATDLAYVASAELPLRPGWCAVDNLGKLYSSSSYTTNIKKFSINWNSVANGNPANLVAIDTIELSFLSGSPYYELRHMQGGEFSDSNEQLYIVSGSGGCAGFGNSPEPSDGIHVFKTSNWQEIEFSDKSGTGNFLYYFDNSCEGVLGSESPQGVTYWGLNGNNVSNVEGQLHVLLFHWNAGFLGTNNHKASIHHYQKEVYVDHDTNFLFPRGTKQAPFKTFNEAFFHYPIWDGAKIILKAGNYNETGFYNERVQITSEGGAVIIGQ